MNPTISLLISTYNWPEALATLLRYVANQTISPNEILIADDGSDEDTKKVIESASAQIPCPIKHIWQEHDGFRAGQIRNKAIANASGEYIIQIDGDMIVEKHFIEDHLRIAKEGTFVTGSRVNTSAYLAQRIISNQEIINVSPFSKGIIDRINTIRFSPLTDYYKTRYKIKDPYYARGCNMAYWREDVILVNGYNEDMIGWGREDSEFACRLLFLGRRKIFLKFGAVAYHLYHSFNSRERESINIKIWENTIKNKIVYCTNGIDKYLANP